MRFCCWGRGGCSNLSHRENRALIGGGLGVAGGALIAATAGGSVVAGALIGGAGGAAIGAVTANK
ncbi:MAG: hypothetical protein P4M00_08165 [Azospirillaceae bacterium]|nr:hypothetical protein [Azospirillaceae bacterium]